MKQPATRAGRNRSPRSDDRKGTGTKRRPRSAASPRVRPRAARGRAIKLPGKLEHWPIDRLKPYGKNPRTHMPDQVAKIVASLREFGWTNPILVDRHGGIVAGHGRLLAARELGLTTVPVICLGHLTGAQRRAYLLADNRLALDAGWDPALLAEELTALKDLDFDLELTGFDRDEIDSYLDAGVDREPSDGPGPGAASVTELGDLWLLGEHRLFCGEPSDPTAIDRLVAGSRPPERRCFTITPEGQACDRIVRHWQQATGRRATLEEDGASFEETAAGRRAGRGE